MYKKLLFIVSLVLIVLTISLIKSEFNNKKSVSTISKSICDTILSKHTSDPIKKFDGIQPNVNFSKYPELNLYRSTISKQVADGPNFAGHFTFVYWGCGTDCLAYTIIDISTGDSVFSSGQVVQNMQPNFNLDSRLMIFNSKEDLAILRGMSLDEIDDKYNYLSQRGREYYELIEEDDGYVWLNKLCTENILDGIYSYK